MPLITTDVAVLCFGERRLPGGLAALPCWRCGGSDRTRDGVGAAVREARRLVVVGTDADLAEVLTSLMRSDRLDVEVAHVRGRFGGRRARTAPARRVPLIRDDTGTVLTGAALWLPPEGAPALRGEAVVDDSVLFDGDVAGVRIEPTPGLPGLRATVLGTRRRWVSGRAAQLGTTGARVVRDEVPRPREVTRSTFYRHTTGWLRVG